MVAIKTPESFDVNALNLPVRVILAASTPQKITNLVVRLRADSTKKKQGQASKTYQYLGEAVHDKEAIVDPAKPMELYFSLQLDFSPIDSFEIPPENMAVASEELKAAAAANRTSNYTYSVEVTYKVDKGPEQVASQSIKLVQPDQVHVG